MSRTQEVHTTDIDRGTVTIGDDPIRLYDVDGNLLPSASTITGHYEDPAKEEILKNWREKYNGKDGNAYWQDLLNLKALRGTIAHAVTLSELLEDDYIWGGEEREAYCNLKEYEEYRKITLDHEEYPWEPENIPFFNEGETPLQWSKRTTPRIKDEILSKTLRDVHEVVAVEEYLYSLEHKFAGQVDLIYRTKEGNLVVCDLKTSKGVYYTHKLQTAGYALAYEEMFGEEVDMLKVARSCPESWQKKTETQIELQWEKSREELQSEFNELAREVKAIVENGQSAAIRDQFRYNVQKSRNRRSQYDTILPDSISVQAE